MTPQEKAKELVNKMTGFTFDDCKYNALITVDEIINSYETKNLIYPKEVIYWQEVKQEIEKL